MKGYFDKKENELDVSEVAQKLGVTPHTVRNYIYGEKLKAEKRGKNWYITKDDYVSFTRQQTESTRV